MGGKIAVCEVIAKCRLLNVDKAGDLRITLSLR